MKFVLGQRVRVQMPHSPLDGVEGIVLAQSVKDPVSKYMIGLPHALASGEHSVEIMAAHLKDIDHED
jgi:hypothetical protein